MANLFDGSKNIPKSTKAKMIAEMEVYTIPEQLHICGQYLRQGFNCVVRSIAKLFKKEIAAYKAQNWDVRYQKRYDELLLLNTGELEDVLQECLQKKIRASRHAMENTDTLSAQVTRFASKGLKKAELSGLSIAEKNDYIFQKYPHQKPKNERKLLRGWLILAVLVAIPVIVAACFFKEYAIGMLVALVVGELAWEIFVSRRIKVKQLMHFVWLAASEFGKTFAIQTESTPSFSKCEQEKKESAESLRAYHTLRMLLGEAQENLENLSDEKHSIRIQIEENQKRIKALQESKEEDSRRMIQDKEKENLTLQENKENIEKQCEGERERIEELSALVNEMEQKEIEKLLGVWEREFEELSIAEDMVLQVIQQFSYEDIERIEKRMLEICSTTDPYSLAEYKNGRHVMPFRTNQGDIASLYFLRGKKAEDRIQVVSVSREVPLRVTPLTKEEVLGLLQREASGGSVQEQNEKYRTVLEQLSERERMIEKLCKNQEELAEQKAKAEKKLKENMLHVSDLQEKIEAKSTECENLRQQLIKAMRENGDTSVLKKKYEECHKEMLRFMQESANAKTELEASVENCKELEEKNQSLQEEILRKSKEMEAQRQALAKEMETLQIAKQKEVGEITVQLENAQGQVNTYKSLYEKAKQQGKGDAETIAKLERAIRQAEELLHQKEEEKQAKEEEIEYLCGEFEEAENRLKEAEKRQEEARAQAEYYKNEILSGNFVAEARDEVAALEKTARKVLKERWAILLPHTEFANEVYNEMVRCGYVREIGKIESKLMELDTASDPMIYNERGKMAVTGDAHRHVNLRDVCLLIFFRAQKEKGKKKVLVTKIADHGDKTAI